MVRSDKELSPITQKREKAGLTQSELAQLVGVSENTIANWEKGSAANWIGRLIRLCQALDCRLEDLLPEADTQSQEVSDLYDVALEALESYFTAIVQKDKKKASKITSFATMNDRKLRFWLGQIDRIVEESKPPNKTELNFGEVLSMLNLQNLVRQLQDNYSSPKDVSIERFKELIDHVNLDDEFINKYARFDDSFTRQLILQTWTLTVYVIGWRPGQKVLMHHHGNSLDAIRVIKGEMTHWLLTEDECVKQKIPFEGCSSKEEYPGESKTYYPGDLIFIDRRAAHQIANYSDQDLVTLHFRFGSPPDDNHWKDDKKPPVVILEPVGQYQLKQVWL